MAPPSKTTRRRILGIATSVRKTLNEQLLYCTPTGECFNATIALSQKLQAAGIPHRIVSGTWHGPVEDPELDPSNLADLVHVWIEFPQHDNAVLDITADQFSAVPEVWFPASRKFYEPEEHITVRPDRGPPGLRRRAFTLDTFVRSYRRKRA